MNKLFISIIAILTISTSYGRVIQAGESPAKEIHKRPNRVVEPTREHNLGVNHRFGRAPNYLGRDGNFSVSLLDSSLNGYGGYIWATNPLAFSLNPDGDEGYVAAYRQFQGLNESSGYIGSSQTEDGEEWFTEQRLNVRYPTGQEEPNLPTATGLPAGRYPSAVFPNNGLPTALWNEYTNSEHGGGDYGGYPLFTYDSQGLGEFSSWVNPFHMNNGCNTLPCDPPDLWKSNAQVVNLEDGPILTSLYDGWFNIDAGLSYFIRSSFHANGYFLLNDPYVVSDLGLVSDDGNNLWRDAYVSEPDYHINDEGVGHLVQTGYVDRDGHWLHTLWIKRTEDAGESWNDDNGTGYLGTGYHPISDDVMLRITDSLFSHFTSNPSLYPNQLHYGDSIFYSNIDGPCFLTPGLFPYYDPDVRTDQSGGLHVVVTAVPVVCSEADNGCEDNNGDGLADSLFTESRYGSAGHYYFYAPDPVNQPGNWRLSLLNDLSDTYFADWTESSIPYQGALNGTVPMNYFYPQITLSSEEGSEVMWYAGFEGSDFEWDSDTISYLPNDIDLYLRKSTDLGLSWSNLDNLTNTPGGIYPDKELEVGVHLASSATDDEVGIFFQVPDFYTETIPPASGYEDFMTRVHVGIYGGSPSYDQNFDFSDGVIESFDEPFPDGYWGIGGTGNSDPNLNYINITHTDASQTGPGAMQLNYSVHNSESWGGFVQMMREHPDGGTFDWSFMDSISFSYSNIAPPEEQNRIHLRTILIDDEGEFYYSFHYILDEADISEFNTITMPLVRNDSWDGGGYNLTGWSGQSGNGELNTSAISAYIFEFSIGGAGEGDALGGSIIIDDFVLIDDTSNNEVEEDVTPPNTPENIFAIPGSYFNLVTWTDVNGEEDEVYHVYASQNPITDLFADGVDLVAENVLEGSQTAVHYLVAPLNDADVSYYYAVVCMDESGNVSEPGYTSGDMTNQARGIPTISLDVPNDFEADGDLTEWYESDIMPFIIDTQTGHIATGNIDDDSDLSASVYLAIDNDYLYFATEAIDNDYHYGDGNWWEQDAFELFIGLYDWRGPKHDFYFRGDEPDYSINATENGISGSNLDIGEGEDFQFEAFDPDYLLEGRISLDDLAELNGDERFYPQNGMRIPLDIYFHDNDFGNWEGNLAFSHLATDQQWWNPREWSHTWIGDTMEVVEQNGLAYELYMIDSYGDGWNGASLDLFVNGQLVIDDATIEEGDEELITFYVNVGDVVSTEWTEGSYDGECAYGIFNEQDQLVAEAGTDSYPDLELSFTVTQEIYTPAVWFSEYGEGSSNNKYLEIYNGSGSGVNLDDLVILGNYNGNNWSETFSFAQGAYLDAGDVYVLANSSADSDILQTADEIFDYGNPWYITSFNGDDVRALALAADPENTIFDIIGTLDYDMDGVPGEGGDDDPGSGFAVAGVNEGTKDHTLQRKWYVDFGNDGDWWGSAGTNTDDSEWIVLEQNDWSGIGQHQTDEQCDQNNDLTLLMYDSYGDGWNGNILYIGDQSFTMQYGADSTAQLCIDDGLFSVTCSGGSYPGEVYWAILDQDGNTILDGGAPYSGILALGDHNETLGCTDPNAVNFDSGATFDDGSCYFEGDSCDIALDYVALGGSLDGSTFVEGALEESGDVDWYTFTLNDPWDNLVVSLSGSDFDTQLELFSDCGTFLAYNDDYDGVQSQVDLVNVSAGTYHARVYGYGSAFGNYVLSVETSMDVYAISSLSALAGTERVYLSWNPINPNDADLSNNSSNQMHTVDAGSYYYNPNNLVINQGDSVEFINQGGYHDVQITSGPEMLSLPPCSGPCDIGFLVFNTPGDYEYICSIGNHESQGMVGTIIVNSSEEVSQAQTDSRLLSATASNNRLGANSSSSNFEGSVEDHVQWRIDNKKQPVNEITGARGVSLTRLYDRTQNNIGQSRNTEVFITLYDSYGDGHDADAYLLNEWGDTLEVFDGGWVGTSNANGPYGLDDGYYTVNWDENGTWLSEQTMRVVLASDTSVVIGEGAAPSAQFVIGDGFSNYRPDLTVNSITYDSWTGRATVSISNIGNADAVSFYTLAYLEEPDTNDIYPQGYFQWEYMDNGLAAGESVDITLWSNLTLPEFLGGYQDDGHVLYAMVDGYGNYVEESNEANNVGSINVVNSNPLANISWNIMRDGDFLTNVTHPELLPGEQIFFTDEPLVGDNEYCYVVTQFDGDLDFESEPSNESCATPSWDMQGQAPEGVTSYASGYEVFMNWYMPEYDEDVVQLLPGAPSRTRQGGDNIQSAIEVTELPTRLEGTIVGYSDDYDCNDIGNSTSPDVVYSITPSQDMIIDMTTCFSNYDTKIFVYENEEGNFAASADGSEACNDDGETGEGCTEWTSRIDALFMTAGNTYYVVIDGWSGSEGDYVLDINVANPLLGYTIMKQTQEGDPGIPGLYSVIGQAGPEDTQWSTLNYVANDTTINLAIAANYLYPGNVDLVQSEWVLTSTEILQGVMPPVNLSADSYGEEVYLAWEPPLDVSNMELAYDDGFVANAWEYEGAVAVRFRIDGTYSINGLANAVWTGGWPDEFLGETPFTLSVLALDEDTDLPGDTLYQEQVLVDADPSSETYGWAMTSDLAENPLVVSGDVFVMYSDFGYGTDDRDIMGCDAFLDYPGNRYEYMGAPGTSQWMPTSETGNFNGCGDWVMHMFADFTYGRGDVSFGGNGVWVDPLGSSSVLNLPNTYATLEAANTKEEPRRLDNPPVAHPEWPNEQMNREQLGYVIYRNNEDMFDVADPSIYNFIDTTVTYGSYEYYATSVYFLNGETIESGPSNTVEIEVTDDYNEPPYQVVLINPVDGMDFFVDENNLEDEVPFIWTQVTDPDDDLVEYWLVGDGMAHDEDSTYYFRVLHDNEVSNASFEDGHNPNDDWQWLPHDWQGWPHMNSMHMIFDGDGMYNSDETFSAWEGNAAIKLWGLYEGENTENNIFQTFYIGDSVLSPGDQFYVNAHVMTHRDDAITEGGNFFFLFAKYFTSDWGWIGMDSSQVFTSDYDFDEWHYLDVMCNVPEGAQVIQVGAMLVQPNTDSHGGVYLDDFRMHLPVQNSARLVSYEDLAAPAINSGVTSMEWSWDVYASDRQDMSSSSSGSRMVYIDVDEQLLEDDSCPNELTLYMYDSYGDGWNGNYLNIESIDDSFTLEDSMSYGDEDLCMNDGTYFVTCGGGIYQSEVSWAIEDASGNILLEGSAPFEGYLTVGESSTVFGCTDPDAANFNPDATDEDGSCIYQGDSCHVAFDFVYEGGSLDGNDTVYGTIGSYESAWYSFTLLQDAEELVVSLLGSDFDTKLDLYESCDGDMIATNDDFEGLQSMIYLNNVPPGTYKVRVYGYDSSEGDYALSIDAGVAPAGITDLTVQPGIERNYLSWSPATQNSRALSQSWMASIEEQIEWRHENKKRPFDEVTGARGVSLERLYDRTQSSIGHSRNTEVFITLNDSYGDGHDGDAYVIDASGNVLHTLEGGWSDYSNSYGPFSLSDGVYAVEWNEDANWLEEQSMEVVLASDTSIVLGSGSAPYAQFTIGDGFELQYPDLIISDITYDNWTGRASVSVQNIGEVDAGFFYVLAFLEEPDISNTQPSNYLQWGQIDLLAVGDTSTIILDGGASLPEATGGYDNQDYRLYAMADAYDNMIDESNESNNVEFLDIINHNPFENTSWDLYRSVDGSNQELVTNLSFPDWLPGTQLEYVDDGLEGGSEYCYVVAQLEDGNYVTTSNLACGVPAVAQELPEPTNLEISSSGFDVNLSWSRPDSVNNAPALFLGNSSRTRQGGDNVENATVITELGQLIGTTSGYTDDYDEECPYSGSTSPDVVYSFTPASDLAVSMNTCYSYYDTKFYVYENTIGNLATTVNGNEACSDDNYPPGVDDCTAWTSYIEGISMIAGNTYYLVIDGYGGDEGDYVLDVEQYDPLAGYTIYKFVDGEHQAIGQAGPNQTDWSTILFTTETAEISLGVAANYGLPGSVDLQQSGIAGPVTTTIVFAENPTNLTAYSEEFSGEVQLNWEPPFDASNMELAYDDGIITNAYNYEGAVAVRFRINGSYSINGLANAVWTGGWPDEFLGETPFTLSVLALDEETDLPGDTLYQEQVLVDADPASETYGWAMTSNLGDNPITVDGDVFIMYSDFGWGTGDMDIMGCDSYRDFPGNAYEYMGAPGTGQWMSTAETGSFEACGDWVMHMFADFTTGRGEVSFGQDGVWIDQSGAPSLLGLPVAQLSMEAASTKESPNRLVNPPAMNPEWASSSVMRDLIAYNIYRNDEFISGQESSVLEYVDSGLNNGDYTYFVTAQFDDYESIPSNSVDISVTTDDCNILTIQMYDSYGDGWNGNTLNIDGQEFGFNESTDSVAYACLVDGVYSVSCGGGSYQSEVSWAIFDAGGDLVLEGGAPYEGVLVLGESNVVFGCMDSEALNFDPNATYDDGSCFYEGDSCDIAYSFVGNGGSLDGESSVENYLDAGDSHWYEFTLNQSWDNLTVSLLGSEFDTQLELWSDCGNIIAANDDYDGLQSQIDWLASSWGESVPQGDYQVRVLGYGSSSGNYVLTIDAYDDENIVNDLSVWSGFEGNKLTWSPLQSVIERGNSFSGRVRDQLNWQHANKKEVIDNVTSARGVSRERMYERIESNHMLSRDAVEVVVTLFDSYGDGHYGGDSDGDAYIMNQYGDTLEVLEGPWTGPSSSYGPFELEDGLYSIEWDPTAPWLSEQTMEVTLASDSSVVLGSGAAPSACFAIGGGNSCGLPDLAVSDVTYDNWTGRATVEVVNVGGLDAGYFYTMAFLEEPDTSEIYPPGYFQYAWSGDGLAAGDTMEIVLIDYQTLPGFIGGYDNEMYTIHVMVDSWGNYVEEGDEANNLGSTEAINSNPLENTSWNIWRSYGGEEFVNIETIDMSSQSFNSLQNSDDYSYLGEFSGNHYYVSEFSATWTDAAQMLEEINFAHMVTITSDSENVFLSEMVPDEEVWIGLSQDFNGDWSWINGEYLEYQNWAEGQPDSSGSHAVLNWSQMGLWDDQDGYTQQKRFIVEFEGDGNWQNGDMITYIDTPIEPSFEMGEDGEVLEYCYFVTQVEGANETDPSNEDCGLVAGVPYLASMSDTTIDEDSEMMMSFPDLHLPLWDMAGIDGDFMDYGFVETFSVFSDNEHVHIDSMYDESMGENMMHIYMDEDWNGEAIVTMAVAMYDSIEYYSDTSSFVLTINPVNDAPWIQAMSDTSMLEDDILSVDIMAMDVDSDSIIVGVDQLSLSPHLEVSIEGMTLTVIPEEHWYGSSSIKVFAADQESMELNDSSMFTYSQFELDVIPVNDSPGEFTLVAPHDSTEVGTTTPLLNWSSSANYDPADEISYTLIIDTPEPGVTSIDMGFDTLYQFLDPLMDNTTYFWSVMASDLSGESVSNVGGFHSFRVNTENDVPSEFLLLSPENESMIADLTPTFHWEEPSDLDDPATISSGGVSFGPRNSMFGRGPSGPGNGRTQSYSGMSNARNSNSSIVMTPNDNNRSIVSYDVYISLDASFTDVYPEVVTTNQFTPQVMLDEDAVYYWKVVALDDDGGTAESDVWTFWTNSVNSVPSAFNLLSPSAGDTTALRPAFTWTESNDQDLNDEISYVLSYGSDPFELEHVEVYGETSYSPNFDLEDSTEYVWQVAATDQSGASYTTPLSNFIVEAGSDGSWVFTLNSPGNETEVNTSNVLLTWDASVDENGVHHDYLLRFGTDPNSLQIIDTELNYYEAVGLVEGTYYWNVTVLGENVYIATDTWSFNVELNDVPLPFTLLEPADGSEVETLRPVMDWSASVDVDQGDTVRYVLHLDTPDPGMVVIELDTVTNYQPSVPLEDNTTYHWKVVAHDMNGASTENDGGFHSFITNLGNDLPEDFALLSPDSGSMMTDLTPTFHWESSSDPDGNRRSIMSYLVHIGINLDETVPDTVFTNSYTLGQDLDENKTYEWKVTAVDDDGGETESATWSFWTNSENSSPNPFLLISPLDDEHINVSDPTLTWFSTSDEDLNDDIEYRVELGLQADSLNIVYEGTDTTFSTGSLDLQENTTYYWQVTAIDLSGATTANVGGFRSFRVNTQNDVPSDFALISPDNSSMVTNLLPTLHWQSPSDPDDRSRSISHYEVYMDTSTTTEEYVTATDNSYTIENELLEDAMYYWKVVAVDDQGGYTESGTWTFWTNSSNGLPSEFTLLTPLADDEIGTLTPVFTWTASEDSDMYDQMSYVLRFGSDPLSLEHFDVDGDLDYEFDDDLMDNTDYYWQVSAIDQSGAVYATDLRTFRTNTENDVPTEFTLLSPEDESFVSDASPLLVWSMPNDSDGDEIEFEVFLNGESVVTTDHNYHYLSNLSEDETYEWHVVATDNQGGFAETSSWTFTVNTENSSPSDFQLLEPANGEVLTTTNPVFCWEDAIDADVGDELTYVLRLGTNMDSLIIVYDGEYMEDCFTGTDDIITDNSIYYWSVTAVDQSGATTDNSGGFHSFIVNTENDAPIASSLISPSDGSVQSDLTPHFYWTESNDPDPMDEVSYVFSLWNTNGDEHSFDMDSNNVNLSEDLFDNSEYHWFVTSVDMENEMVHSDTVHFFTDVLPEPPSNFVTIAPANGSEGLATEVEFVWNATVDPDPYEYIEYQVRLSVDIDDSSTYVLSELVTDTSVTMLLEDNTQYFWTVVAMDSDGFVVGSNDNTINHLVVGTLSLDDDLIPETFALYQNYPNPFNPITQIRYGIPEASVVNVIVYDVMGHEVTSLVNQRQDAGYHVISWDATNYLGDPVSAGMYFYSIRAGDFMETRKMILLK